MRPILFSLFGEPIYSYPLMMGLSWGLGYNIAQKTWESAQRSTSLFRILFVGTFISAWAGAKLFFLLFSSAGKAASYAVNVNFWLGGGFVFYGGLVGGVLFLILMQQASSQFNLKDIALFIPALFFAHAVGRIGCFLTGCCFGEQCPLDGIDRYPVQLMESVGLFLLYYAANLLLQTSRERLPVFLTYLWGYACMRFSLEFLRGDEIRGAYLNLSTSQWVSLGLVLVGSFLWLYNRFSFFGGRSE